MTGSDNFRGALFMGLAMAAFTLNDTCMKLVTAELPLAQAILLRGMLATAALAVIGWRRGVLRPPIDRRDGRRLILRSVAEVAATLTFLAALRHMPLANLSAILQALPLAVTLSAALILGEPVGWRRMAAIAIGFAGVLLVVRPGTEGFDIWSIVALVSVGCVVVRDLVTRRLSGSVPSVSVALLAAISVTATAAVLVPFGGWEPVRPGAAILIAGAAGFLILGYLLIVMAMRVGEVAIVAPFRYTSLLVAIVLGWAVFGDIPGALTLTGAALVVATGIYTFHRERRLGQKVAVPSPATLRVR